MATAAFLTNEQTLEAQVTGPGGATRLFIATGIALFNLTATSGGPPGTSQQGTFFVHVGPSLTVEQFRRAVATASLTHLATNGNVDLADWRVTNVDADFDDEIGRVQVEFDVVVFVSGPVNSLTELSGVGIQATILAAI
jgi:hypothetical protein